MSTHTPTPLTDDELSILDTFLLAGSEEGEERLLIDEAHGYLTALHVSGADLEQDAMLEAIWGQPEFTDDGEKEHITQLLLRMDNEIKTMLADNTPFDPLAIEEETSEGEILESFEGWCFGFMLGVADQQSRWDTLPKDEQSLLEPIATLALLHSEELEMGDEEYDDWVELLPGAIASLYSYWQNAD